jgi:hypothetical protein
MKIVVGYDGSDSTNAALADMRRAGLTEQAEVMIVSISSDPLLPPPPPYVYELLDKRVNEDVVVAAPPSPKLFKAASTSGPYALAIGVFLILTGIKIVTEKDREGQRNPSRTESSAQGPSQHPTP